jgi:TetR/AcrR family transcriptional repressor of nem operon
MSDIAAAIMDAAERRMRLSGFYGFSFREIAADVGVKSSSVHYHFPTKEKLAAAVIHRYTDEVAEFIDKEAETAPDPVSLWTGAFRGTLCSEERMCPCAVLGAVSKDLPRGLAAEVRRFFKMCLDKMMAAGLSESGSSGLLATITGALVVANALNDVGAYDRAAEGLMRKPQVGRSKQNRTTSKGLTVRSRQSGTAVRAPSKVSR